MNDPCSGSAARPNRHGTTVKVMRGLVSSLLLFLLLLPASASAYTLVMRGGRRVEVAGDFRVSGAQLIYEAAPGVSVALPLELIDVAATELANQEPAGSFLRRARLRADARRGADPQAGRAQAPRTHARTLTNRELEPARLARLESERAYERRRIELGLPSAEQAREMDGEEERALSERARRQAEEDADAESYWRNRAAGLREEAAARGAEIDYLRGLLAGSAGDSTVRFSSSSDLSAAVLTVIAGSRPFVGGGGLGRGGFARRVIGTGPPTRAAFAGGRRFVRPAAGVRFNVNGGTRANIKFGGRGTAGKFARPFYGGRFGRGRAPFFAPGVVGFVDAFDYVSADAYALLTRLRELESERAGLAARWRLLEEEARRAGAQPGWLRL
jgi:hypothetical protein